jgi:hypothetical protein
MRVVRYPGDSRNGPPSSAACAAELSRKKPTRAAGSRAAELRRKEWTRFFVRE